MLRKIFTLFLSVVFLVFAIPFNCLAEPSDIVNMPDAGLKQAVKDILNIDYDDITVSDIQSLTGFISFNGKNISDITGIEYAKNITGLNLGQNSITDLGPLKDLTGIKSLYLDENQISDISALVQNADAGGLLSENADNYIDLRYNLLDLSEDSKDMQDISYLQSKGINVVYEDDIIPSFFVNPEENSIMGNCWSSQAALQIVVKNNGVDVFNTTATADTNGWFYSAVENLATGFEVTVSDGSISKSHIVEEVEITGIDEETDKVFGRASPGSFVNVNIFTDEQCTRIVKSDDQGIWAADFSTAGELDFEQTIFDIMAGIEGSAQVNDDDGDATEVRFRINDPFFIADLSEMSIYGEQWDPNVEITISINSGSKYNGSVTADEYGNIRIELYRNGVYIEAGDIIELSKGSMTKSLVVKNIVIDEVSSINDTVSGSTDPDLDIWVHAYDENSTSRNVVSDEAGNWQADFSTISNSNENIYDIASGKRGSVDISNEQGNITRKIWYAGGGISGKISDAGGLAVPGADVTAFKVIDEHNRDYAGFAIAGADGTYSLKGLVNGSYEVEVRAPGKVRSIYDDLVAVNSDAITPDIDFVLEPGGSISGRVTDKDGNPLSNVSVDAWIPDMPGSGGKTDPDGYYTIEGLSYGEYELQSPSGGRWGENDASWIIEQYERKVNVNADTPDVSNINFVLERGGSLSGMIRDAAGNPIEGAHVSVRISTGSGNWEYAGETFSGQSGFYIIEGLSEGSYMVEAEADLMAKKLYNDVYLVEDITAVVVTASVETQNIDFVLETGGQISGKVTDEQGIPLADADVWVHIQIDQDHWEHRGSVRTDSQGNYKIQGLADGVYTVEAQTPGMVKEYYNNAQSIETAAFITIAGGSQINDIDFELEKGGSISGYITDDSGNPLANVSVDAFSQDHPGRGAKTNSNGQYIIDGLELGTYTVQSPSGGRWGENDSGWIIKEYEVPVTVSETDPDVNGINFVLEKGGSISGRVSDKDGNPLADVSVEAWIPEKPGHGTKTDENGYYEIGGLAEGSYQIESPSNGRWGENDGSWIIEKYPVSVDITEGNLDVTDIDFVLEKGGSISGRLTDKDGNPLADVSVEAWIPEKPGHGTKTDENGYYEIGGLVNGFYDMQSPSYGRWSENDADWIIFRPSVPVEISDDIPDAAGIDFTLIKGGTITGRIASVAGSPLENVSVRIYRKTSSDSWDHIGEVNTDSAGLYKMTGLPDGELLVETQAEGFIREYYNNAYKMDEASLVSIIDAGTVGNIDFVLEEGGSISGKVVDLDTNPIPGARIHVYIKTSDDSYEHREEVITNSFGEFVADDLQDGSYIVEAEAANMIREYYNNVRKQDEASLVVISGAVDVGNIDFSLERGGSISGRVTDKNGNPLADVSVDAWIPENGGQASQTDENGYYTISGLVKGTYQMQSPSFGRWSGNDSGWVIVNYPGTVVISESDFDITGIDFVLEKGGTISGNITGATGEPLDKVRVRMHRKTGPDSWEFAGEADTNSSGSYRVEGLSDGDYLVESEAESMIRKYYNNVFRQEDASLISIIDAGTVDNIDFNLEIGGSISGKVTDKDGNPIPGISVDAWMPDMPGNGSKTDLDGNYTVNGLQKGIYEIQAPSFGRWGENDADWIIAKYTEMVTINDTTLDVTGIDFILEKGGSITGRVTTGGGDPLADARVQVHLKTGDDLYEHKGEVRTSSTGDYEITGLAEGSYIVEANAVGKVTEFYNNAFKREDSELINILGGSTADNIDFALETGGSISGRITDSDGNPQSKISVDIRMIGGQGFGALSDADGYYQVSGISLGEYEVWAPSPGRWGENDSGWVVEKLPDNVVLTDNIPDVSGINIVLSRGGSISGRVLDSSGNPLSNISVEAWNPDLPGSNAKTDENGDYTISGLEFGSYEIRAPGFGRWAENDADWISVKYQDQVTINDTQPYVIDVDFLLYKGGSIGGTIRDANSDPLEKAVVRVFLKTGDHDWDFKGEILTDIFGAYRIGGLPDGQYMIEAEASGKAKKLYNDTYINDDITLVVINTASNEAGIDFILDNGGSICGYVKDKAGNPLPNVSIDAFLDGGFGAGAQTDENGYYIIRNIPYGEYNMVSPSIGRYAQNDSYWVSVFREEKVVVDGAVPEVTNMDFVLVKGGSVEGRVVDEQNDPVIKAKVVISSFENSVVSGFETTYTDSDGRYVFDGVLEGDYFVEAEEENKSFLIYDDVYSYDNAAVISVVTEQKVSNIDLVLKESGSISGKVTDINGDPLSGVSVEAYIDGVIARSAETDVSGNYTIANLPFMQYSLRAPSYSRWASNDIFMEEDIYDASVKISDSDRYFTGIDFQLEERTLFTVSFDSKGGDPVNNVFVPVDSTFSKPVDPVRAGYIFTGWYIDDELLTLWNFEQDKVNADVNLKAGWYRAGDLNKDGTVNTVDALITLQIASGRISDPGEYRLTVADVNKDGRVNSIDALKILQFVSTRIIKLYD